MSEGRVFVFMKNVPGTKYIHKDDNGKYDIIKMVNGKLTYYGCYQSLVMALMLRDYLISVDWPIDFDYEKYGNSDKYIYFIRGKYIIQRTFNDEKKYFGSYPSLSIARDVKLALSCAGWPYVKRNFNKYNLPKYINFKNGFYCIRKGEEYYGFFKNFEDAVIERDMMIDCDWDWDLIVEME